MDFQLPYTKTKWSVKGSPCKMCISAWKIMEKRYFLHEALLSLCSHNNCTERKHCFMSKITILQPKGTSSRTFFLWLGKVMTTVSVWFRWGRPWIMGSNAFLWHLDACGSENVFTVHDPCFGGDLSNAFMGLPMKHKVAEVLCRFQDILLIRLYRTIAIDRLTLHENYYFLVEISTKSTNFYYS